jgi:hypothetical protein
MMTVDSTSTNPNTNPIDSVEKYLPEPQYLKAVLKLDDDVCTAWLNAIQMAIKMLIDHCTFILGETPHKIKLIILVNLSSKPGKLPLANSKN